MRFLVVAAVCISAQFARAADHAAALEDYLTDDVVAVAYVDLGSIDTLGLLKWSEELGLVVAEERGDAVKVAMVVQERLDELVDLGASGVYLLVRASDISHRGPSWVVPIAEGSNPKKVLGLIRRSMEGDGTALRLALPVHWATADGAVLGGHTEAQLEQLRTTRPEETRDLSKAWSALGAGDCGLLLFGDDDSRRVVREMFPPLPEPFAAVTGPLLADGVLWGGVSLKLPPTLDVKVLVETSDDQIAGKVSDVTVLGFKQLLGTGAVSEVLKVVGADELLELMRPQVEGSRITFAGTQSMALISRALRPLILKAREAAQERARKNKFQDIGLAFHRYVDSNEETFPAQASYDDSGKPLLSWRVHLLPYLEQNALYSQFRLDEPWDSQHNRQLIAKMPDVYADPSPALRKINREGKTTFVVPVGEGTMFDQPVGSTFKDIVDGTSNTILLVEVVPEKAVVWTQPDDWEVEFGDPWEGVRRSDRESITVTRCDGNVYLIGPETSDEKLSALLTKFGGEIIPYP